MTLRRSEIDTCLEKEVPTKCASPVTNPYTIKIVLTLTVSATDQEQAEALAAHVANRLPEDVRREVDDLGSPVTERSRGRRTKRTRATASVTLVSGGQMEPDTAPAPDPSLMNLNRFLTGGSSTGKSPARSRSTMALRPAASPRANRSLLYTRTSV
ncbi:MAG: hypothetical protein V4671_15995 [Armatimonadota bacterium]